jgi:uncharacterized protein YjbI with pentapeptide repeats
VLAAAGVLAVLLAVVFAGPRLLYPPLPASRFAGVAADKRIELETNRLKLQNDARATLLQGLAGGVLLLGAYFTWRQLGVTREGQITDRYTKAVDQLGSDHLDVRVGGIYALERIARDSPPDRATIEEVLTAYLRDHAPWPPPPAPPSLQAITQRLVTLAQRQRAAWQRQRAKGTGGPTPPGRSDEQAARPPRPAADVQAAVTVFGRRQLPPDGLRRLDLTRVDLRHAELRRANLQAARLDRANLQDAILVGANLQDAWLDRANLQDAILVGANLQGAQLNFANLQDAQLMHANLQDAQLGGANLQNAVLDRADLQDAWLDGANLQAARLDGANLQTARLDGANLQTAWLDTAKLQGARADKETRWPDGFDPQAAEVTVIDDVAVPRG